MTDRLIDQANAAIEREASRNGDSPENVASSLPTVVATARQLRMTSDDALDALYRGNTPPRLFVRAGNLARVVVDERGQPYADVVSEAALRGILTRASNFVRYTKDGSPIAISPPLDVVKDIMGLGRWAFPPLNGIIEAPAVRPDGSIIAAAGYDAPTGLFYIPAPGLHLPRVADSPSEEDIADGRDLLLEILCDFPFDSEGSRVNAVAALCTPILRPMIDGATPLHIGDKPQAGTGAGLWAEIIAIIATGRNASMQTAPRDDEGWRKLIFAALLRGQTVICFDNLEERLEAASLASALSAYSFQDRILGRTEVRSVDNRATWLATGNNVRLGGDLPRRSVWIRLDAHKPRPWLRDVSQFRHPHLLSWVAENRGRILGAVLTLIRGWVAAGRPEPSHPLILGGLSRIVAL